MAPAGKIRRGIGLTLKIIAGVLFILGALLAGDDALQYGRLPPLSLMGILVAMALGWAGDKIDRSN